MPEGLPVLHQLGGHRVGHGGEDDQMVSVAATAACALGVAMATMASTLSPANLRDRHGGGVALRALVGHAQVLASSQPSAFSSSCTPLHRIERGVVDDGGDANGLDLRVGPGPTQRGHGGQGTNRQTTSNAFHWEVTFLCKQGQQAQKSDVRTQPRRTWARASRPQQLSYLAWVPKQATSIWRGVPVSIQKLLAPVMRALKAILIIKEIQQVPVKTRAHPGTTHRRGAPRPSRVPAPLHYRTPQRRAVFMLIGLWFPTFQAPVQRPARLVTPAFWGNLIALPQVDLLHSLHIALRGFLAGRDITHYPQPGPGIPHSLPLSASLASSSSIPAAARLP